jgi:hypothetical protein
LLSKGSCLARTLGATKFINMEIFVVLLKSDLDAQQSHLITGASQV